MSVRRLWAGVALAGLVAAPAALHAQAGSEDLARLREAIDESRERVAHYEREERGLLEALEALERSAELLARDVRRARRGAREARDALEEAEREARGVAERLEALERAMSRRAVALYRAGELGAVPLLFSAGDLREFLSRVHTLRRLLSHDALLLARHRETVDALEQARAQAEAAAVASREAERTLVERSAQLAEERERKRALVARMKRSRALERSALAELETAARALEEAVAALPERGLDEPGGTPGAPFASLRGSLPAPVDGRIARGFGRVVDREFLTETFRKGVEFEVAAGTPVRAVADGRVRYAGRFRGYGNTVILDHGDRYFSVSAHLSEIRVGVGDWVRAGDALGLSGDTGSLRGEQLYFELRRGAEALDPRPWLSALGGARTAR